MEQLTLSVMTREMCHELYRDWQNDPALFPDPSLFRPYHYVPEQVDRYFDSKQQPNRVLFAILQSGRPIGEVHLKNIDPERLECTLSIHMQNDSVKGQGYGTRAERLAVAYAFRKLGMESVLADTVLSNVRSQHILEKIGFRPVREADGFRYYRLSKTDFVCPD